MARRDVSHRGELGEVTESFADKHAAIKLKVPASMQCAKHQDAHTHTGSGGVEKMSGMGGGGVEKSLVVRWYCSGCCRSLDSDQGEQRVECPANSSAPRGTSRAEDCECHAGTFSTPLVADAAAAAAAAGAAAFECSACPYTSVCHVGGRVEVCAANASNVNFACRCASGMHCLAPNASFGLIDFARQILPAAVRGRKINQGFCH